MSASRTNRVANDWRRWCVLFGFLPVVVIGWAIGLAYGALARGVKLGLDYVERL